MSPASLAYSAAGSLIAPLVNMSALRAQFGTAKANQVQAMYRYQKTVLNAYVEVVNEMSNIEKLQEITTYRKAQSEVMTLSIETSGELYRSAKAGYLEVLMAQQSALRANLELVDASKRLKIATVNVYKALGGGWK